MKNFLKPFFGVLVAGLAIAATYNVADVMRARNGLIVTGAPFSVTNSAHIHGDLNVTNVGADVYFTGGITWFDQLTAVISSNETYFASGGIYLYKDASMTWAWGLAGVSTGGVFRGSAAELTGLPLSSVDGLEEVNEFAFRTYDGNIDSPATNGVNQYFNLTNDPIILGNGSGSKTFILKSNGTNRTVYIPTNFFRWSTNGLTLSGTNWAVSIPTPYWGRYSEVAPSSTNAHREWGMIVSPAQ